ncbi:MAG: bifunctional hydroxymethylpyrimidine kinase/phosphomethylpyrimidine kinase [Candidatus Thermoplasmatota archaeon]|nr:bifunctional hydroxymethylpyrimidine kinase/phosphomethylpyrimidine kinase [Candidatus Thermoplasmatota archaeon]
MRTVLVVAGSDSGGGAGIQADLKALAALDVHGATALTAVTAQNTQEVVATEPLSVETVRAQIQAVRDDLDVHATKTGMLYSPPIVKVVAEELASLDTPLVVDPVLVAASGSSLHASGLPEALQEHLLPMATLLTPNLHEAETLTGAPVREIQEMKDAAQALHALGPEAVLVKGGHLEGELVDILYDGTSFSSFPGHRYRNELHGSGCAYASTIAGYLALGRGLSESIQAARKRVAAGFATAYAVGQGLRLINAGYTEDRWQVWTAVRDATEELLGFLGPDLVPEVGVNLGYALPTADTLEEVCAITGRIVRIGKRPAAVGPPAFGASRHVARIILAAMQFDPAIRSAMNLRYDEGLVARARAAGLEIGTFDRKDEPAESETMEWGTREAIRQAEAFPEVIYDLGGPGKVPMVRFLGASPSEVVERVRKVVAP